MLRRWLRNAGSFIHRLVVDSGALIGAAYAEPIDAPARGARPEDATRVQRLPLHR
ncbi:hypothetical protein QTH90_10150 [Variovorax sp. J2P1-59]|uniref:hypothetical protein n=1 Tax=Variovorax flavidus TaxID=3053501 RepID=UPI002574F2DF|nr:hypothetical protein [Variovorax sp. J2P1-59]MDM0074744.1 hypothetical protein [Variovorax sp. J2P1-59]